MDGDLVYPCSCTTEHIWLTVAFTCKSSRMMEWYGSALCRLDLIDLGGCFSHKYLLIVFLSSVNSLYDTCLFTTPFISFLHTLNKIPLFSLIDSEIRGTLYRMNMFFFMGSYRLKIDFFRKYSFLALFNLLTQVME